MTRRCLTNLMNFALTVGTIRILPLRAASMADFEKAISRLSASVAEQGPEMGKVLEWNAQYGEVKGKRNAAPSSLYL